MGRVERIGLTILALAGSVGCGLRGGRIGETEINRALGEETPVTTTVKPEVPELTVAPTATATPEATATKTPTPTATPEALAVPEVLPAWPKSAEKAAALFGSSPDRWEVNPNGGWHLREEGWRILINPKGYLMEGYYDTKPGKDPLCFASAGVALKIQGGTIWPERGTEESAKNLQKKMAIAVWEDKTQHPCQVILPKEN